MSLRHITREPGAVSGGTPPTLVLLHGVGSNERDLMGLAPSLDPRLRIVSVRAPLVLGADAFGWYRVGFRPQGLSIDEREASDGLEQLMEFLRDLDLPSYLMGFSQGCVMALSAALREPERVLGVVGMSGRLLDPLLDKMADPDRLRGLPVMVVHGTSDNVIPIAMGRAIRDRLSALPVDLTYREYPMGHYVTEESISDIRNWLSVRLSSPDWRSRGA